MNNSLLFFILLLTLLDAWIVAALASMRHSTLARLVGQEDVSAGGGQKALELLGKSRQALAGAHMAHVCVYLGLGALSLRWLDALLQPWAAAALLAVAALGLGVWEWWLEMRIASRAVHWLVRMEPSLRLLMAFFYPLYALPLRWLSPAPEDGEKSTVVTEEELKNLLDAGQQEGVLESGERRMIYSIFDLGDTLVREVMVPRIDVLALDAHTSLLAAVDALLESGYSRVPVYEGSIDNIIGLLYAKDLLSAWRSGAVEQSLKDLLRPAYFVPEAKTVDALLAEMQAQRVHMAVVVDEYGGVAGLVTLEDIVEEIVGEIRDEYDQQEEAFYQQVAEREYLVSGRMDLDDFNDLLHTSLPSEEADTLGGFIYSRIGRVPVGGETLRLGDLELTVEQVSKRRIRKVRARKVRSEAGEKLAAEG